MPKHQTLIGGSALLGLTLLSGAVLTAPNIYADSSGVVNVTVNVPAVCTLAAANNNLAKTINPGTGDTIGTSKLKALCNDSSGFAIYAIGYSNEQYGNNNLITSLGDDYKIVTGLATSGDTSNWNMTIETDSTVTGDYGATIANDFDSAHIIPNVYTKIAYLNSGTDQSIGTNLTATFDAYIAPTQPASTYEGKVRFLLIHPNITDGSTTPAAEADNILYMQDVGKWGDSLGLHEEIYAIDKRDGKGYTVARLADGNIWMTKNLDHDIDTEYDYTNENTDIGWNATTNSYDTASWHPSISTYATDDMTWAASSTTPESYDPGERYWSADSQTISDIERVYIETCDMTTFECDDSVLNDAPDIIKDNLLDALLVEVYLSTCQQGACDATVYARLKEDSKTFFNSCTYEPSFDANSCDMSLIPSSLSMLMQFSNMDDFNITYKTSGDTHYHLGNYYNWTAAIAMNDSSSYTANGTLVDQSICPSGWTLPRVGYGEDTFKQLLEAYGLTSSPTTNADVLWSEPLYLSMAGVWNAGPSYVNKSGSYRSSVAYNSSRDYTAQVYKDGRFEYSQATVRPAGLSIRCIARPVTSEVTLTQP